MKRRSIILSLVIIGLVLAVGVWRITQRDQPTSSASQSATAPDVSNQAINQTWYIKSDSPVATYDCPSIDCNVADVLNGGSTVVVVGAAQGEAMIPIRYGSRTTYVIDSWLSRQPPIIQPSGIAPRGATATCKDGWTSYSANRRGTCSHHGGVRSWYR